MCPSMCKRFMISLWLMLVGACAKCGSAICKISRAVRNVPLFSSDVALVPHLDLRPNGLSIAKRGIVSSLCLVTLSCARVAHSML